MSTINAVDTLLPRCGCTTCLDSPGTVLDDFPRGRGFFIHCGNLVVIITLFGAFASNVCKIPSSRAGLLWPLHPPVYRRYPGAFQKILPQWYHVFKPFKGSWSLSRISPRSPRTVTRSFFNRCIFCLRGSHGSAHNVLIRTPFFV